MGTAHRAAYRGVGAGARRHLRPQPESAGSGASGARAGDHARHPRGRPGAGRVRPARLDTKQGCARCHSIAGRGNPRSPLDGVGARLSAVEIRRWITPPQEPAALPDNFRAWHANLPLTEPQREALVAYLLNLRDSARAP